MLKLICISSKIKLRRPNTNLSIEEIIARRINRMLLESEISHQQDDILGASKHLTINLVNSSMLIHRVRSLDKYNNFLEKVRAVNN